MNRLPKCNPYFETLWGEPDKIVQTRLPNVKFPVSVFVFCPESTGREFFTFLTSGLASFQSHDSQFGRSELVLYSKEFDEFYAELLHLCAKVIVGRGLDINHGDIIPHGAPPRPVFPETPWTHILFHESGIEPDSNLSNELTILGAPVFLYNLMLISAAESQFIEKHGIVEFSNLLAIDLNPIEFEIISRDRNVVV
ncbi:MULTISPECIES: suppressor of fused domain protein [Thalassoglobus]|uniref:Suppressor of fused protein (SUFU) n=1 Tax=Thalassoglobus polymorphus TaxID=2527994 RepID=A0A517QTP5_9PLAN|nr:suppressor of fused domain protein [Thalassoglobus polymorphus]QDT35016.1 Suppressor of fused protein (SUFU) [Thalassoglobus polymorphus]